MVSKIIYTAYLKLYTSLIIVRKAKVIPFSNTELHKESFFFGGSNILNNLPEIVGDNMPQFKHKTGVKEFYYLKLYRDAFS